MTNGLGLGGTEKGLVAHAVTVDRDRFDVSVVAALADGPRRARLEREGIAVSCAEGERARLGDALRGADLVHVYRSGGREPLVPAACRDAGVPLVVETNVFGQVDPSPDEALFDCHLFVSRFCALRYRRRTRLLDASFHARHRVSSWPVEIARLRGLAPDGAEAKRRLGLDPQRPVVGRVGREDDRKWRDVVVDMVPLLLARVPEAQVLLVGATPAKLARLARLGVLDRVRLVAPTADDAEVAALYAACDVFVTASEIGESCSVAIAEASALGVPVVTTPTPWVDDGQVEQVVPGETGALASTADGLAAAAAGLLEDAEWRRRAGEASALLAERMYDADRRTRQLESLYDALLAGRPAPPDWEPGPADVDAFEVEYAARLAGARAGLGSRELLQVELGRRRERVRWAARAGGQLDRRQARLALSMLAARRPSSRGRA